MSKINASSISHNILPLRIPIKTDFSINYVSTSRFGLNSQQYFASKIWNMFPSELKNLNDIEIFESEMKIRSVNENSVY